MLTRGQIVQTGIERAGRGDLLADGRRWLNLFLQSQYKNEDWNWLIKSGSLTTVDGQSIPSDYDRMKYLKLISNGSRIELEQLDVNEFEYQKVANNYTGQPKYYYIDELNRSIYFWPMPDQSYSLELQYYHMPDFLEETAGDDSDEVVWGEGENILVQAVYVDTLQFLDDARFLNELKVLENMIGNSKLNAHDRRGGKHRIPLGRSFRKRFK